MVMPEAGMTRRPSDLDEHVVVDGDHAQRRPVRGQLDLACSQPQLIAQWLGDDQSPCLVNG